MRTDNIFDTYEFPLKLINGLEKHLKSKIIGQDKAIEEIINSFTKNIIRINNIPLNITLVGSSGIGKSMIFKEISSYLYDKTSSYKMTTIDCSKLYANEITTSLFGVSSGFTGSDNKCLLETIYENLTETDFIGGHILVFSEIDKLKGDFNKNNIEMFFSSIMQLYEENFHLINTNSNGKINIDLRNFIICVDSNIFMDKEEIKQAKIGFGVENENIEEIKEIDINDVLNGFKSLLPISIYNRIYNSVIKMDELKDKHIWEIFSIEYNKIIEGVNKSLEKLSGNNTQLALIPNKKDFEDMLKSLNKKEGARGIRNYCENKIKLDIIKKYVIPIHKENQRKLNLQYNYK